MHTKETCAWRGFTHGATYTWKTYTRGDMHMKETYARRRRRDIHMRRHAHEGDMRTKETYTRKDIHTEGH